jgi:transcription elongation factor Elf1
MGTLIDINRKKTRDLVFTCGFCGHMNKSRTCVKCGTTNANAPLKMRGNGKFGRTAQRKVKNG